jgi:hypothetical protein
MVINQYIFVFVWIALVAILFQNFNVENKIFSELSNPNLYNDTTNPENKPIKIASIISLM